MEEDHLAGGVGAPGPEDWANGAAILAAGLTREARALAGAAAGLRGAIQPAPGETGDVRRLRALAQTASEAAARAALALDAAELLAAEAPPEERAARLAALTKRAGLPPATLAPLLRAAALASTTDDAAARIAAASLAQSIAARLDGR
ncbi:MAG TPA: hypothetical protein VD970_04365 [Acetobacteraceae bacterium]|nr:hypothetical protein [Acetobacteraceae bacterium]